MPENQFENIHVDGQIDPKELEGLIAGQAVGGLQDPAAIVALEKIHNFHLPLDQIQIELPRSQLGPNEHLNTDQALLSPNKEYVLVMQADGNLVLARTRDSRPLWASGTPGSKAVRAIMQSDGNFVLYTAANVPVWASNTVKHDQALKPGLAMQNDGNLVVYHSGTPVWASGTAEAQIADREMKKLYFRAGSTRGPLGPATSGLTQQGEMFVRDYQGGRITWKSDTGAEAYAQFLTRILYKGLHCFGETSGFGSDEPYTIVSAYNPASRERVKTFKFGPYEGVDGGASRPEILEIYSDYASDIVIHTVVMEHDSGDEDRVRDAVQDALKQAADAAAAAFGVPMPPEWVDTATAGIAEIMTSVLGLGDDVIGQDAFLIRREELINLANQPVIPLKQFGPIQFNYPVDDATRPPISDNDASYKVYFEVTAGRYSEPRRIVLP